MNKSRDGRRVMLPQSLILINSNLEKSEKFIAGREKKVNNKHRENIDRANEEQEN